MADVTGSRKLDDVVFPSALSKRDRVGFGPEREVIVFRPWNGTWFVNRTIGRSVAQQFGANGDVPLPRLVSP